MHGKNGVFLIAVCLMFLLLGNITPLLNDSDNLTPWLNEAIEEPETNGLCIAGTPHTPIVIDGDANFSLTATLEGWPGDGSSETPYIITGLNINLDGSPGHCISIINTQVNFTISDCNLAGASVDSGSGIYLENVQNGRIVDNICQLNTHGVFIKGRGSRNCILINNTCNQNVLSGIQLAASLNITVTQNNCSSNYYGINVIDLIDQSGYSGDHIIASNFCYNNTYGICLGDFNPPSIGPLFTIVVNNNCSSNHEDGIRLLYPGYHTISKNNCNRNGASGILLRSQAVNNTLVQNNCNENNQSGIYLYGVAFYNNLTGNICSGNSEYGLFIRPPDNMENDIQWNVFDNNLIGNAYDGSENNNFDYNYWSDYAGNDTNGDYFGDTPYTFTSNSDSHPLIYLPTPPEWKETPTDQIIEYGTHFVYNLNVTTSAPVFWSLNWTFHLTINTQGIIESIGNLSLGIFGVHVTVKNVYNVSTSAKFNVIVVLAFDNKPPSWVVTPTDFLIENGIGVDIQIHALDCSGIERWNLNDTTHFNLDANYYELGSTARITNRTILEPASYGLNITVYDPNNNFCSVTFRITVLEEPTTTITSPTTSIVPSQVDPMITFVLGTGVGGTAVIVLVLVLSRKKP